MNTMYTRPSLEGTSMLTLTPDTTAADASYLLGWALFEVLNQEHPGRVRFPQHDEDWLHAPGDTIFVPVGEGTPVAEFARSVLPTIQREINRQMEATARSADWFIELDYRATPCPATATTSMMDSA